MMRRFVLALALACGTGCAATATRGGGRDGPPEMMVGTFVDDYGSRYVISADDWLQLPRSRHRIMRWNLAGQYLIAQNESANPVAGGRWMRIDWIVLSGMPPYAWAFCYSAYDALTAAAAEATALVRRDTPRTGCNGFPFSRMARARTSVFSRKE